MLFVLLSRNATSGTSTSTKVGIGRDPYIELLYDLVLFPWDIPVR